MRSVIAKIREHECIGCTKCISACPVDAIIGTGKFMHTVIESECIGCELCVKPCPVDCIDIIEFNAADGLTSNEIQHYKLARSHNSKKRFQARNKRLAEQEQKQQTRYAQMKANLLHAQTQEKRDS